MEKRRKTETDKKNMFFTLINIVIEYKTKIVKLTIRKNKKFD